jgi:hypothetical protein
MISDIETTFTTILETGLIQGSDHSYDYYKSFLTEKLYSYIEIFRDLELVCSTSCHFC